MHSLTTARVTKARAATGEMHRPVGNSSRFRDISPHTVVPLFACISICLSVLVPEWIFIGFASPPTRSAWPLAAIFTGYAGIRLAWQVARGLPRLFEFSFWLFVYVFLGCAPLAEMRASSFRSTTPTVNHALDVETYAIIITGTLAFEVGYLLARQRPTRRQSVVEAIPSGRRSIIMAALGLVFAAYYIHRLGVHALFIPRNTAGAVLQSAFHSTSSSAIVSGLSFAPLLVSVPLMVQARMRASDGITPPRSLIAIASLVLLIEVNPISATRYTSGTVYGTLLVTAGAAANRHRIRLLMCAMTALILLGFGLLASFHLSTSGGLNETPPLQALATSGDFDSFDNINNTIAYVDINGSTNGRQSLGVLGFFVPRSMWHSKPPDTGVLLATSQGYQFSNISAPLWAELYINFLWPGVVVGFIATGYCLRRLSDRALALWHIVGRVNVTGIVFPFYLLILLRGSLLQATGIFVMLLVSVRAARAQSARAQLPRWTSRRPTRSKAAAGREMDSGTLSDSRMLR